MDIHLVAGRSSALATAALLKGGRENESHLSDELVLWVLRTGGQLPCSSIAHVLADRLAPQTVRDTLCRLASSGKVRRSSLMGWTPYKQRARCWEALKNG
jgi:hypothetical protein